MMNENAIYNLKLIIISIACGLLPTLLLIINPKAIGLSLEPISLYIGLITAICNFYLILWAWSRIFLKKRIALATSVIVIKYGILGIIIYKIVSLKTYDIISFLIGLSSIFIMIILYAFFLNIKNN